MAEDKRKREYSEARKRANIKWDKENLDRASIALPSGTLPAVKAAAAAAGESLNAYIKGAIEQRMEREKQ